MNSIINDLSWTLVIVKGIAMSLAAICAMVGSIKIFNKWNTGSYNAGDGGAIYYDILMWGGSCIFFVLGRYAIDIIF